jgi:magnesium-protoporphyrin IX monomethyl ester (oxidative) cyclase
MFLNDLQRSGFYAAIGLNARDYDIEVIKRTNETAGRVFPIILDVENPEFYERLDRCAANNIKLGEIAASNEPGFVKTLQKLPLILNTAWQLIALFLMPPIRVDQNWSVAR